MVEYILRSVGSALVGRYKSIAQARKEARKLEVVGAVFVPSERSEKCIGVVFAGFHMGETYWFTPDYDTYLVKRDGSIQKVEASRTIAKKYFLRISRDAQ